jgi:hypothetical protein
MNARFSPVGLVAMLWVARGQGARIPDRPAALNR